MKFKEETLNKNYIYKGKILSLRSDDVVLCDGKECKREIVEHNGGAGVLYEKDGKILFVKQYRYAFNEEIYEIPAGKIDKGETPLETAFRELKEECGLQAEKMRLLFKAYPSPGYTQEIIYIYKAENCSKTNSQLDEDEFLDCVWIDKKTVKKMLENGEINDAKTLLALSTITDL